MPDPRMVAGYVSRGRWPNRIANSPPLRYFGLCFLALIFLLGAMPVSSRAELRTLHFGNLQLAYDFPSSFEYLGRTDDSIYFGDGKSVLEVSLIYDTTENGEELLEQLKLYPEIFRAEGYFDSGLEYEINDSKNAGRRVWVNWEDGANKFSRISYAVKMTDSYYTRFTIEFPAKSKIYDWLEGFIKSFVASNGKPYPDGRSPIDWQLEKAKTPARSLAEKLYDACSSEWNKNLYAGKILFKVMAAVSYDGSTRCPSVWNASSMKSAISAVKDICKKYVPDDECYLFARGNELSEWAQKQRDAVAYGKRDSDYRAARVASRPAQRNNSSRNSSAPSSNSSGGDIGLGDILQLGGALLNGWNQGKSLGSALGGGNNGGGSKSACPQFLRLANTCRQRQLSLGGGTTPGTQAGSEYQCYVNYTNAARAAGC